MNGVIPYIASLIDITFVKVLCVIAEHSYIRLFMSNQKIKLIILILYLAVLSSCGTALKKLSHLAYDDSQNRQFWTAAWSPDDKYIAIAGVDSTVRIYKSSNLKLHTSWQIESWIHKVAWHPSGKILAIATSDKYVALLNMDSGLITFPDNTGGSRAMGWNNDGSLLAVADLEETIKIWNKEGALIREIQTPYHPELPGKTCLSLDWHPTENIFVVTNSQIYLINEEGKLLKVMQHGNPEAIILCAAWHPSGSFFVLGDYGFREEGKIVPTLLHFWSKDGRLIRTISGSKEEIRNLAWNKDGSRLATASDILRIWNDTGVLLHEGPPDGNNNLWGIDWDKEGKKIVTASRFKTISIWDRNAKLLRSVRVPDKIELHIAKPKSANLD